MQKVIVFSSDNLLFERYKEVLQDSFLVVRAQNSKELLSVHNKDIVFDANTALEKPDIFLTFLVNSKNRVLVIQRVPQLDHAKRFLSLGARAYGNSLMSRSYILSAIEALTSDDIWLIPSIMTQFVGSLGGVAKSSNDDEIYSKLTDTEKKVASLLKDALKNQEIADALGVSLNTIKKHIKNIYDKLGVSDRVAFNNLFYTV
ncbi:MAG: response regulator transcription factor [Sulfuricurvum sp.]